MKRFIIYIISVTCFFSCKHIDNSIDSNKVYESSQFLKDSTRIFSNITDLNINGKVNGNTANIKYYSITKDEFFNALEKNFEQIKYFSRKHKINEGFGSKTYNRKDSILNIEVENECISLIDLKESQLNRARNFFFQSKIGGYYIVKRIQFEDGETMFINSKSGNIDLSIPTINVFTKSRDSLIFISDSRMIAVGNEPTISLIRIRNSKLDTLLHSNTNWFTSFAFFDNNVASIYYIHEKYEQNDIGSTYARMDIE